ncbi:MAG: hypothetical protein ACFFER_06440 [Candidatus Thorarchaeota archaeon]
MGRKVQEFRPNVVLADAIYTGLSTLVRLAQKRKNKRTSEIYDQIASNWREVQSRSKAVIMEGSFNSYSVHDKEPVLRRLYLQMLWYSTEPYGNKELKRVYNWRKGTVGPLNALLNIAGAALRDILVPRYPFPDPEFYQVRKYPDESKKIIPKQVADKLPLEKGVETTLRAGYRSSSKYPRVLLRHPTLPALDFGDMIRAHLVELCRQCFIHGVPRSESQRYIRLLIHRLIPFLDWVYTRGKVGRKNFYPDADKELRKIVLEIRTKFSRQIGFEEGISRQSDSFAGSPGTGFLKGKVIEILSSTEDASITEKCETILMQIEAGFVTDIEVSRFIDDVTRKTQQEGNDWHRILLSGYPQPRSLKEAVFAGDHLLQTPSGLQYMTEVPVLGGQGAGKIDLVLFARVERGRDQHIWTPVMVLEVKSKMGLNFNLYGKKPRTRKPDVYVPVLNSWKTPLQESEWTSTVDSIPPTEHLDQLDAYENALLSEYNSLIGDPLELKSLWKGVVTLDVSQDYENTKMAFDELVEQIATKLLEGGFRGQWQTVTIESRNPEESPPRIAVTMTPAQGPEYILKQINPTERIHPEDPFIERVEDDVFFTQYISVSSPTSSGKSAAVLAKNWHLLNHLAELEETGSSQTSLFWIDLIGDYPHEKMVDIRFRLEELEKAELISLKKSDRLGKLLNRIIFVSLRDEVDSWLFEDSSSGLDALRSKIALGFQKLSGNHFVVVDGWSDLELIVPTTHRSNLEVLELSLLQVLKGEAHEVIWVGNEVSHPRVCETYQRPCVSPLYYNSPRRQVVDEIIWNLPTSPQRYGWMAPEFDDYRVIIQDLPVEHTPWTTVIHVPYLKGWNRKFSAEVSKKPIVRMDEYHGDLNQERAMLGRSFHSATLQVRHSVVNKTSLDIVKGDALGLIPGIRRPRGEQIGETEEREISTTSIPVYHSVNIHKIQPSLSSRLHLDLNQPPPFPNRLGKEHEGTHVVAEWITRGWIHKEIDEPDEWSDEQTVTITRRSPTRYSTESSRIDTSDSRRMEIQRLSSAAAFLRNGTTLYDPLFSLYEEIISICDIGNQNSRDDEALLNVLAQVRDAILRRTECHNLWNMLRYTRLSLGDSLTVVNRKLLKNAQRFNTELLELYGMNLFLAVLSVADRVLRDHESGHCLDLWSAIARWQLYQIGFRQQEEEGFEHRYDFQAIHSNLTWRARNMMKTSREESRFPEQHGLSLFQEEGDRGSIWLLFPSIKKTIVGALLEDQIDSILRYGWHRGEIDPQSLKDRARDALLREGWKEYPVALVSMNNQHILYTKIDEDWIQSGLLEYGNPPKSQSQPVRWVRLSQPSPETLVALHGYRPSEYLMDARAECDRVLKEASEWSGVVREVSCFLTINLEKSIYRIDLNEGSKSIARKETPYADEIIRFLRYPQRVGEYFSTSDGTYLKWDPQKDVEYDEVRVKNSDGKYEFYNLSVFKPRIYRYSFYPDSYRIPATCKDFLKAAAGEDITLRITVDGQRKDRGFKKYFRVHLDGLQEKGHLIGLETDAMSLFDVALLSECGQMVDAEAGMRYEFAIDSKALVRLQLVHLLSEYPRLQSSIIGDIEELDDIELAESKGVDEKDHLDEDEGPELRFVNVNIEESSRRSRLDVIVQLCNVDDETDFEELTVVSLSSEIAKTQPIAYAFIEQEVSRNLRGRMINDDTRDEILENVERALEGKRIVIDYY